MFEEDDHYFLFRNWTTAQTPVFIEKLLLLGCQRCWQLSLSLIPKVGLFLENKPYTGKFGLCLYDIPSVQQFVKFSNSERVAYCYNDLQQVIARLKFFFWCIFYGKYSAVADYFVLSMQLTFTIEDGPRFRKFSSIGWVCGIEERKPLTIHSFSWYNSSLFPSRNDLKLSQCLYIISIS